MDRKRLLGVCALALALFALVTVPSWAQGSGRANNTSKAPLGFLKQALNKAGATALDSTQESALTSLISTFRSTNQPGAPNAAEKSARDNYATAILSGSGDPKAAADQLAGVLAARQQAMLEAEAQFAYSSAGYPAQRPDCRPAKQCRKSRSAARAFFPSRTRRQARSRHDGQGRSHGRQGSEESAIV